MDAIWQLSLKSRLREWRGFRKEIEILSVVDKLQAVVDFWKSTPISARVIDPYDQDTWPTPWEILHTNMYDENVVALGIAYTLHYSNVDCRILLIQSTQHQEIKLIILVDETYILNYNYGSIDTIEVMKEFEVLTDISISTLT
jgi:hypothetical protein